MPSFEFEVEYSKSGRAACKYCKEKIDKDVVRLGFKVAAAGEEGSGDEKAAANHTMEATKWHHFGCLPKAKGKAWFKKHLPEAADNLAGFNSLKPADRDAVVQLLRSCRGEIPIPDAPQSQVAGSEVVTPQGKKRKAKDGDVEGEKKHAAAKAAKTAEGAAAVATISEAQMAALTEAKTVLAKKTTAMLGAMLVKNGLPKAGRKEELVERIAESQVLGVPPTCSTCEKKKLNWSRATGKYSCPGFFDEEAGHFRKCKGLDASAEIERTPWQELMVVV